MANLPDKLTHGQSIISDGSRVINGTLDYLKSPFIKGDNQTIAVSQNNGEFLIKAIKKPSIGGGNGSATESGYFTVINVSTTDPATGITTPKVAVVDNNQANPLTAQYCGAVSAWMELPVATKTELVCASKVKPVTDPVTYQPFNALGGYVVWAMDRRTGEWKSAIEYEQWAETLYDTDILNGVPVQRLRIAKVTLQKTMINEQESWSIKELIQLHTGYIWAWVPQSVYEGTFKVQEVYPEDYNPALWTYPTEGDRLIKITHGNGNYGYTGAGKLTVGGQTFYCTETELSVPVAENTTQRIYIRIFWDEGTEEYDYEYGMIEGGYMPPDTDFEVHIELAQVYFQKPIAQVHTTGNIDLNGKYWCY